MARKGHDTQREIEKKLAELGIEAEVIQADQNKGNKLTLLKAFELLLEKSKDSGLTPSLLNRSKQLTDYLCPKLDITPIQAVFLSVVLNGDRDEFVTMTEISRTLACSNLHLLNHLEELDELERKQLLLCYRRRDDHGYRVPMAVIDAFKANQKYERPSMSDLNIDRLFVQLDELYNKRDDNEISLGLLGSELNNLIDNNQQLQFCRMLKSYKLEDDDLTLLVYFAHKLVNDNDDAIILSQFSDVFEHTGMFRSHRNLFRTGRHVLLTSELVEPNNEQGMFDGMSFHLTSHTKRTLLAELDIEVDTSAKDRGLTSHTDIVAKPMYYNPNEQKQVDRLQALLDERRYADIAQRLKDKGMRTGFTCLFYGSPGTGKTETVLQLARHTGRDIMQVNITEIKSKWVGDSEKNIKAVFDRYRRAVKDCDVAPILLFNEADAVLGVRKEGADQAVEKMENAIQNIILQEMENLQGIMIATTNLTGSLDKAFERRFLYKIKFDKPSVEAKRSIWRSMIPELSEAQADELAQEYAFSGGQIENIARKKAVDDIINGTEDVDINAIRDYCDSELIDNQCVRVGFCA
ncbi:MAG: AAA family ATPase [Muribaculaceae bacterium]|nr:AAA family ATPase [Muribaculaceae bacterium]